MTAGGYVVSVSGTSGAGKSTLVEGLVAALTAAGHHVTSLHFDNYAAVSMPPQDDLVAC